MQRTAGLCRPSETRETGILDRAHPMQVFLDLQRSGDVPILLPVNNPRRYGPNPCGPESSSRPWRIPPLHIEVPCKMLCRRHQKALWGPPRTRDLRRTVAGHCDTHHPLIPVIPLASALSLFIGKHHPSMTLQWPGLRICIHEGTNLCRIRRH